MLYEVSRKNGVVVLFGIDAQISELAKVRAQDTSCRQLPRVAPHNAYHVRVLFDPESSNEENVKVQRIDAAFAPERWTCVYRTDGGDVQNDQSPATVHYLSDVPRGVSAYFQRLIEQAAFSRLMFHPDSFADMDLDDEDERAIAAYVRPALQSEQRDDEQE